MQYMAANLQELLRQLNIEEKYTYSFTYTLAQYKHTNFFTKLWLRLGKIAVRMRELGF